MASSVSCFLHSSFVENFRNALFGSNNYFYYPRLVLSSGYVLEARACAVNWIRGLYHKSKDKLISSYRMLRSIAYVNSLNKKKVPHALALFSTNLTTALEIEHGEAAKGMQALLHNRC